MCMTEDLAQSSIGLAEERNVETINNSAGIPEGHWLANQLSQVSAFKINQRYRSQRKMACKMTLSRYRS